MIDEARVVSAATAVDDDVVVDREEKGMVREVPFVVGALSIGFLGRDARTDVLGDAVTFFDVASCEDAAPLNAGSTDTDRGNRSGG
jgi:hypothetical protein